MIMTTRSTYKPGHTADELLREMDAVIADIGQKGVTEKELTDSKIRYRSNFYNQLESTFGKAHLLSVLALFRDDPNQINSLLQPFENVTSQQIRAVAKKYLSPKTAPSLIAFPRQKTRKENA